MDGIRAAVQPAYPNHKLRHVSMRCFGNGFIAVVTSPVSVEESRLVADSSESWSPRYEMNSA